MYTDAHGRNHCLVCGTTDEVVIYYYVGGLGHVPLCPGNHDLNGKATLRAGCRRQVCQYPLTPCPECRQREW